MSDRDDPFHHLHDEAYAAPFDRVVLDHRGMVAMAGRTTESLAGEWRFTLDLFDEGLRQRWYADEPLPPAQWRLPRDYDAGAGDTVPVPACFTALKPEWTHFEGSAWYTRDLVLDAPAGRPRAVLRVGAANYLARVFLNGECLGAHRGGSTPFFVELAGAGRPGPNRLQIQVCNRRAADRVPMHHIDWFNHGGLYREVDLLWLPEVFIRDWSLQAVQGMADDLLSFDLTLSDPVEGEALLELPDLGLSATLAVHAGSARARLNWRVPPWSPATPRLHRVRLRVGDDTLEDMIGFRRIERVGTRLLLNGEPLLLKGICVHEDDARLGKQSTEADVRRCFADARALGCNFLRLSHYPHHERVAQIADELGFLLWEEIPVYWAIAFDHAPTLADARNQLAELIRRDRNRASVILWGVGNENADTDARHAFMRRLAEDARVADPTRLVGAACLINRQQFRIEDRLAQHLDVIGLNEYFGWYEPGFDGLRRLLANSAPDRPVIVSETGADALAGHHGADDELYTEENQARVYRGQIAAVRDVPWICGLTPWLLYDFRSERRQNVFNRGVNRKGLIADDKRTRKLAFEVLAGYYRSF